MKTRHYKELEMNELLARFQGNAEVTAALLEARKALKKDVIADHNYALILKNSLQAWTTHALLTSVFYWEETPQGHTFWKTLAERYA